MNREKSVELGRSARRQVESLWCLEASIDRLESRLHKFFELRIGCNKLT